MKSQTTVFLALMTTIYAITSIIPFNIGEPLWIFFGVLFSYFAGSICIAYIYVLSTIDLISNICAIVAVAESTKMAMANLTSNLVVVPDFFYATVIIAGTYLGVTIAIFGCMILIKKLHIIEKFGGIHI